MPDADVPEIPMKHTSIELERSRAMSTNSMHLAGVCFNSEEVRYKERAIFESASAASEWHSTCNSTCRSVPATRRWTELGTVKEFWHPLKATLEKVTQSGTLEKIGLTIVFAEDMLAKPWFLGQCELERYRLLRFWLLCSGLVVNRIMRLLPLLRGWPRSRVRFSDEVAADWLGIFKRDYENLKMMEARTDRTSKKLVGRLVA